MPNRQWVRCGWLWFTSGLMNDETGVGSEGFAREHPGPLKHPQPTPAKRACVTICAKALRSEPDLADPTLPNSDYI
jgi:hypothetical protein